MGLRLIMWFQGNVDVTLEPASIHLRWKRFGVIRALIFEPELSDFWFVLGTQLRKKSLDSG